MPDTSARTIKARSTGSVQTRGEAPNTSLPELFGEDVFALVSGVFGLQRDLRKALEPLCVANSISDRGVRILGLIETGYSRPGQLMDRLGVLPSTVTLEADKLVAGKFVRRENSTADRRGVVLKLTSKGHKTYNLAIAITRRLFSERLERLPPEKRRAFLQAFKELL